MAGIYSWAGKKGNYWYLDYAVDGRRVRKRTTWGFAALCAAVVGLVAVAAFAVTRRS